MERAYGKIVYKFVIVIFIFVLCIWIGRNSREVFLTTNGSAPSYILDAGHGGEDGGAVSVSGAKESDINLEIVRRMDQLLGLWGVPPVVLRQNDVSLHDSSAITLREKKVADLKKRVEIVRSVPSATLVSIHQNSFSEPRYTGSQVFYANTDGSEELAKQVQMVLCKNLQPDNTRREKPIPEAVYLMNHISNRAILVECGFLSNPDEDRLLQQSEYQNKMALVLSSVLAKVAYAK